MRQNQHSELGAWSRVEPPAALDALVRDRAAAVLERRRAEAPLVPALSPQVRFAAPAAAAVLGTEVLRYARALAARGAQLVDGAARLVRRAVAS